MKKARVVRGLQFSFSFLLSLLFLIACNQNAESPDVSIEPEAFTIGFLRVEGGLSHVSVGTDTVWGVNASGEIWRRNGNAWQNIAGRLKQLDVGTGDNVWGVNANDEIWRRDGDRWLRVQGGLSYVSVGSDNAVWGVNANDEIYRRNGNGWQRLADPARLVQLDVGTNNNVWGVNRANQVYRWDGSRWISIGGGSFKHVSVGSDGSVWAVGLDDTIYKREGNTWNQNTNGGFKQLDVFRGDVVWGVNANDQIYRTTGSPQAAPKAPVIASTGPGAWSAVQNWPLVATHLANTTDGRIIGFSSYDNEYANERGNPDYTQAVLFDPQTGGFTDIDNPNHDMFCVGLAINPFSGRLTNAGGAVVGGGESREVSIFNGSGWTAGANMLDPHWYGTAVYMPDGSFVVSQGTGSRNRTEIYRNNATAWSPLPGVSFNTPGGYYPDLFVSPRGTLFNSGPGNMHEFTLAANGTTTARGARAGDGASRQESSAIMMENGRIIMTGGKAPGGATDKAVIIDISGATPAVTQIASMKYSRAYHTTALLPNGEVLVAGGNNNGQIFNDNGSRLVAEIYNPATNRWRDVAAMQIPRNYHSTGLLLQDGRVLMTGGGLCQERGGVGCPNEQHLDGEIYSPPYLFANGRAAARPSISAAPARIGYNQTFNVNITGARANNISMFSMIKLSSVTHTVNTDLRRDFLDFRNNGNGSYSLTSNASENIVVPGYYYLFAVNDQGVPSVASIIQIR